MKEKAQADQLGTSVSHLAGWLETLSTTSEDIGEAAFPVLSMLLKREIDIIPLRSGVLTRAEIEARNWPKVVLGKTTFLKGFSGQIFFIFGIEEATRFIDLMLSGEVEAILESDYSDAFSETLNQIIGAYCQTLTKKTRTSCSIGEVEIFWGEANQVIEDVIGNSHFPGIEFSLDLDTLINSYMYVAFDQETVDTIDQGLHRNLCTHKH